MSFTRLFMLWFVAASLIWGGSALSQMTLTGAGGSLTPTSGQSTSFLARTTGMGNPADKNATVTLSGGNLTATGGGTNVFQTFRATVSASSGIKYWEITIGADGSTPAGNLGVGIANSTQILTAYLGQTNNGFAYFDDGTVYSGSLLSTFSTYAAGDVIGLAVDFGPGGGFFVRLNGGNWNNNGAYDPCIAVGGVSISGMAAGPYFPTATLYQLNDALTANFGATAYGTAKPACASNW